LFTCFKFKYWGALTPFNKAKSIASARGKGDKIPRFAKNKTRAIFVFITVQGGVSENRWIKGPLFLWRPPDQKGYGFGLFGKIEGT